MIIFVNWYQTKILENMRGVLKLGNSHLNLRHNLHSRNRIVAGDPAKISGYLGKSDTFDLAIASFAVAYADCTERDHQALVRAFKSGQIRAIDGK